MAKVKKGIDFVKVKELLVRYASIKKKKIFSLTSRPEGNSLGIYLYTTFHMQRTTGVFA